MNDKLPHANGRIIVIDDNPDIHADFGKILSVSTPAIVELARLRAAIYGKPVEMPGTREFTVDAAHQGEQGAAMVKAARDIGLPYALAFVDMRMPPGWDGLRTIQELWRIDAELQIVVCTAHSDNPWSDIESVGRDSDRLLVLKKPFDAIEVKRLAATLTTKWSLARQATLKLGELERLVEERTAQLEQAHQEDKLRLEALQASIELRTTELRRAATHDDLTGLPNRTLFHDALSQALAEGLRSAGVRAEGGAETADGGERRISKPEISGEDDAPAVAVLFIDFDRFKLVNDSLGHEAGDYLLRMITARLLTVLRNTDLLARPRLGPSTAARLGGDEFCILLNGFSGQSDVCAVAERILKELERPYEINGREIHSTASIGISIASTGRETAEDLVRDADNAMYRAKSSGKGKYVVFDRAMHEEAMKRLTIENDLRRAIERNELRTYFQPIVSLVTGEVLGAEALARWDHPQRGRISPVEFIKIAEESGFIDKLGLWILEDASRHTARWRGLIPGRHHFRINVNVSNRQLIDPQFCAKVHTILERTGLTPDALTLEITETVLMDRSLDTPLILDTFHDMGVKLFLDNFGTGYSSLGVLRSFMLDGLKIDRSFVLDASGRRRYAAVIHTIMNLVHNLGMECVAEGVESIEHVALLQSLGCCKGEGYLFSPPIPAEDMETMLRRHHRSWGPLRAMGETAA